MELAGRFASRRAAVARVATLCAAAALLALPAGCSKTSTAPAPRGSVTGDVRYPGGAAAPGVDVSLQSTSGTVSNLLLVVADASGRFRFDGLFPGGYVVYSHDAARQAAADTVSVPDVSRNPAADTASAHLTLLPGCTLTGIVTLAGRVDHRGTIAIVEHLLSLGATDSTGNYRLEDIPAGIWSLSASHAGFRSASVTVTLPLPSDTLTVLSFELAAGPGPGPQPR